MTKGRAGVIFVMLAFGGLATSPSSGAGLSCTNASLRVTTPVSLPDCRAYEQTSPIEKGGFAAYPTIAPPAQLSSSGEALAYLSYQAFPGAAGNTAIFSAHVSTRTTTGWRTSDWTPRVPKAEDVKSYKVSYVFSSDLSQGVLQVPLIPLAPNSTPYVTNLFLRSHEASYSLITTASPTISPEAICGLSFLALCWASFDASAYAGGSSDFSHVIFESTAQLTENAPATLIESLYEGVGGNVLLVGILPDGVPAATSTAGAGSSAFYSIGVSEADHSVERAVSRDGSRVVFQAPADGGEPDPEQSGLTEVYDRIDGAETIELSAPAPGSTPAVSTAEPATFQTASVDGSRVFFTSSAQLTTESNTGTGNASEALYEFNVDTKALNDLTVDTNPADAASGPMVRGVVDSSTDGSYVYFVANGQLVEGRGVDGQPNLYVVHNGGKPVFIATLNDGSCNFAHSESSDACDWTPFPATREAYVTPDGRHMAFMSTGQLPTINFPSGYHNVDQETGQSDSEIYEYSAPTSPVGTGQLVCASCDPSGAAPIGNALIGGISPSGGGQEGRTGLSGISTPFYRVRAVSENGGRVFYAAPTSLSASSNSIYEYEKAGEGSCADVRGCHYLLSDLNTQTDVFLGSDDAGNNVFFSTTNQLALTDTDRLPDIYDARVDGGIPTPPGESPCEGRCQLPATGSSSSAPPESSLSRPTEGNFVSAPQPKKCRKGYRLRGAKCVRSQTKRHRLKHKAKTVHRHKGGHR